MRVTPARSVVSLCAQRPAVQAALKRTRLAPPGPGTRLTVRPFWLRPTAVVVFARKIVMKSVPPKLPNASGLIRNWKRYDGSAVGESSVTEAIAPSDAPIAASARHALASRPPATIVKVEPDSVVTLVQGGTGEEGQPATALPA